MRLTVQRGGPGPLLRLPSERPLWGVAQAILDAEPRFQCCTVVRTNNRTRVLSWKKQPNGLELRVSKTVLAHPKDIASVVLKNDQVAWARLSALHMGQREEVKPAVHAPLGRVHDLLPLCTLALRFIPEVTEAPPLRWGDWPARAPRRRIQLGACDGVGIRVHPVLDHASVPEFVLEVLLHHELLHLAIPPKVVGGRRVIHSRVFRHRERQHPAYAKSQAWERTHISNLLRRIRAQG
ncbi:MAG: hypothetical protein ACI9VR_001620 [Cognaticolwellia sp.]|jgi:hypothetical protein